MPADPRRHRPGSGGPQAARRPDPVRRAFGIAVRVSFVAAAVGFASWSLRDDWGDVRDAATDIGPSGWLQAAALVTVGTLGTGPLWLLLLRRFGAEVPLGRGLSIFFVGQLGKYIPGSLWSIGMQAASARRLQIPVRVTVSVGLVFVGWHVATAVALASVGALTGAIDVPGPTFLPAVALVGSLAALSPIVVNRLGERTAGVTLALTWRDTALLGGSFAAVWTTYGLALARLTGAAPDGIGPATGIAAFAAGYTVGLLVIVAPAGLGAREITSTALLAPFIGTPAAAAAVLSARAIFTATDLIVALAAWIGSRPGRRRADPG